MMKKLLVATTCLGLLAGCATTKNLVSKATTSDSPLQQVIKAHPELKHELYTTDIRQVFNRVESPSAAQVVVLKAGLMDDSVSAIRTTYGFKLVDEHWKQVSKEEAYKCARGKNTKNFQTALCS